MAKVKGGAIWGEAKKIKIKSRHGNEQRDGVEDGKEWLHVGVGCGNFKDRPAAARGRWTSNALSPGAFVTLNIAPVNCS